MNQSGPGRSSGGGYSRSGGRSSTSRRSSHGNYPIGEDLSFSDDSKGGMSHRRGRNSHPNSRGGFSRYSNHGSPAGNVLRPNKPLEDGVSTPNYVFHPKKPLEDSVSHLEGLQQDRNASNSCGNELIQSHSVNEGGSAMLSAHSGSEDMQPDVVKVKSEEGAWDTKALHLDLSHKLNIDTLQNQNEAHLPFQAGANDEPLKEECPNNAAHGEESEHPEQQAVIKPFDICLPKIGTLVMLKPSLLVKNREKRNEIKRATEGLKGELPRPGIVLLKNYLSMHDQIKIVKLCRDIGLGPGGFYQPIYRDGGRMHLQMMSLGRSWDPDRSEYLERRPIDGAKAPIFPGEFYPLVEKAIKDSHVLIRRNSKSSCAEDILPSMSPDICVVNFYSESGRLGLHQDKDESQESLRRGLPVVSFSIGDSGEFLFGDQRDVDKAEKVVLDSGDVLIFGGKSRHIFHGVSSILRGTAPKALIDETSLRPGRLNLTFREY